MKGIGPVVVALWKSGGRHGEGVGMGSMSLVAVAAGAACASYGRIASGSFTAEVQCFSEMMAVSLKLQKHISVDRSQYWIMLVAEPTAA